MGSLSSRSQSLVFKYILDFIKSRYTLSAKSSDVIKVCHATVELFPSLKLQNSTIGGIVSVAMMIMIYDKCETVIFFWSIFGYNRIFCSTRKAVKESFTIK